MRMNPLLEDLQWRGLIKDHTDLAALSARLDAGPMALYCGYDPTAESLHMGNLQQVALLRRFQVAGHKVIALSGGGTGMIGDPSGRSEERQLNTVQTVRDWTGAIAAQLAKCLPTDAGEHAPTFVNNIEWLGKLTAIELLRDVGKHFTVNYMLAKDSVSSRLGNEDAGISYTEFSYMLLQAYDFASLNRSHDCELQFGGSDQWGNITAGITLIKKTTGRSVHGLTSPLILRSDGRKFGKSESGAVWLSAAKTSPFAMYQYLLNVPDADANTLLKRLTMLDRPTIEAIERDSTARPEARIAQRALAEATVRFVHGDAALAEALAVTEWLFGGGAIPTGRSVADLLAGAPSHDIPAGQSMQWADLLAAAGIVASKSEARRLIQGGGVSAWDHRIGAHDEVVDTATLARDGIILVSKGKRSRTVIRVV